MRLPPDRPPRAVANLPDPDLITAEIAEDLRAALEQFEAIAADLTTIADGG
jgi:type I restriction enzyme M protein